MQKLFRNLFVFCTVFFGVFSIARADTDMNYVLNVTQTGTQSVFTGTTTEGGLLIMEVLTDCNVGLDPMVYSPNGTYIAGGGTCDGVPTITEYAIEDGNPFGLYTVIVADVNTCYTLNTTECSALYGVEYTYEYTAGTTATTTPTTTAPQTPITKNLLIFGLLGGMVLLGTFKTVEKLT